MFILGMAFVVACQPIPLKLPTTVTTTSEAFLRTWEAALDKYREDFSAKDLAIREKSRAPIQAELAASTDPWATLVTKVSELSGMVREEFTIAGRGEMMKAFIKHMETRPSAGLSDIWFLRQVEDLRGEARDVDEKSKNFFSSFDQRMRKDAKWILEFEGLAREQGMVAGKIEELQSLHNQAASYYQDIQQAKAADRYQFEKNAEARANAAKALFAVSQYYNQLSYQQQLLNNLNRPRTCSFFANTMTCQ